MMKRMKREKKDKEAEIGIKPQRPHKVTLS
jgi:hypothetical protein